MARRGAVWDFRGARWDLCGLAPPGLAGDIQFANAATALAALEELEPRVSIPRGRRREGTRVGEAGGGASK